MSGTTTPLFGNAPQMTIGGLNFANPSYVAPVAAKAGVAAQPVTAGGGPVPHTGQAGSPGAGGFQNGPIGSISGSNPLGGLVGMGGGPGGQMIGGGGVLGLASMMPGALGLAAGAANMARKGYNLATEDSQGQAAGYPPMTFGQAVGGMLPLIGNGYGSGAAGQSAYDQAQQAKLGMQPTTGSNITNDPVDRMTTPPGAYGGSDAAGGMGATGSGPGTGGYGGLGNPTGGGQGVTGGEQGFAKGGLVTQDRLTGPKPPGADTGYGALQPGEMVVQRGATAQFAPLLQAINNPTPQNLALIGGGDPRKGAMMLQALMAQMHGGQPPRPPAGPPGMPPGGIPPGMPPGGMPPGARPQPPTPLPSPNAAIPQAGPAQPPKPPLAPPPAAPGMPPAAAQNLARFGQAAQRPPQRPMTPQQMGAMGRFGDTMVAHLTPGEVEVPPQVQTPQLMHAIAAAFQKAGVSPAQFTAGSPQSSRNPATGAPEYNFLSAILPSALGLLGSAVVGPEVLGPALGLSDGMASAIGGGLGGALGSAIGGGNAGQDLVSGLGGAVGGYAGNGLNGNGQPANTGMAEPGYGQDAGNGWVTAAPEKASPFGGINWRGGLGAALGAGIGNAITPKTPNAASQLPAGFTNNITPVNPNFNALLGNGRASAPNFAGYNPYAAVTGPGYTFY